MQQHCNLLRNAMAMGLAIGAKKNIIIIISCSAMCRKQFVQQENADAITIVVCTLA